MKNKATNMHASEPVAPGLTEFDLGGIRNPSAELAGDLIVDATKWVEAIINDKDVPSTVIENPVLVAIHIMAALLDFEGGRIAKALEEIAENMKHMNARPDDVSEVPTDEEQIIIYRALEGNYMVHGVPLNAKEMDAALLRFKKLAGL